MKKTLYLHIGTPKTGTTAIQLFLRKNRRLLKKRGYFIATAQDPVSNRNLRFLVAYLNVFGLQELRLAGRLSGNEENEGLLLSTWFDSFVRRLSRVKASRVVLSEEMLWWALCDGDRLKVLLDALKPYFDVKVIVYLRRQDHYIMSIYQQALKACNVNAKTCPEWIADPQNRQVADYTHYDRALNKLVGYVGFKNIILRVYEPAKLRNRSAIDDFSACIDLDHAEDFFVPQRNINPGLNSKGVALARCMNRIQPGPGFMPFINRFESKSVLLNERSAPYTSLTFSECRMFLEKYEAGNRCVAGQFFGRENLFSEPPPMADPQTPESIPDEDVLPVLLKMIDELSERVEQMERMPRILRKIRSLCRGVFSAARRVLLRG